MEGLSWGGKMRQPLCGAESHAADLGAVLNEVDKEMAVAAPHRARRLGEPHPRGTQYRPPVGLSEWREPLDLLHRFKREGGERGLAVDCHLRLPQRRGQALHHRSHKRRAKGLYF